MNQPESPVATLKAEHQVIPRVVKVLGGMMDRFEERGLFPEATLA
jgi:hypothetical protein